MSGYVSKRCICSCLYALLNFFVSLRHIRPHKRVQATILGSTQEFLQRAPGSLGLQGRDRTRVPICSTRLNSLYARYDTLKDKETVEKMTERDRSLHGLHSVTLVHTHTCLRLTRYIKNWRQITIQRRIDNMANKGGLISMRVTEAQSDFRM